MGQHHVRNYSEMKNVELVGVCDVDKERADVAAGKYDTAGYTNHNDLLDDIDAVSIAVPTTLHKKIALDAIDKGVHVLIEKPIADTIENADEIIDRARKNNVKLMVGHIERFNPAVLELKSIIDKGELGDIVTLSVTRVGPFNPRIRDVGVILDIGVHDIDVMSYLYSENVKSVFTSAGRVIHDFDDHAVFMLNFGNGHPGVVKTNWLTPHKVRTLTATGIKGIAYVDYIESTLKVCNMDGVSYKEIRKNEPLRNELGHFVGCIENNTDPLVGGEEGRHALRVALACIESYKKGEVVKIHEPDFNKKINHGDAKIYHDRGILLYRSGRYDEAEMEFRDAISKCQSDAEAHYDRGVLLAISNKYDEAEAEFRDAIKLNPGLADARHSLGTLLENLGRHNCAEKEFREAIRLNPGHIQSYNNLGILLYNSGRYDEAEREFREAIRINPRLAEPHHNLRLLLEDLKRYEEAERERKDLAEINPWIVDIREMKMINPADISPGMT